MPSIDSEVDRVCLGDTLSGHASCICFLSQVC